MKGLEGKVLTGVFKLEGQIYGIGRRPVLQADRGRLLLH